MLLGKPTIDAFEVYNDFDRNLVNLFRCMKVRPMAVIREIGFCNLNARDDFDSIVLVNHLDIHQPEAVALQSNSSTITKFFPEK